MKALEAFAHFTVSFLSMWLLTNGDKLEEILDIFGCWFKFPPCFGASKNDVGSTFVSVQQPTRRNSAEDKNSSLKLGGKFEALNGQQLEF